MGVHFCISDQKVNMQNWIAIFVSLAIILVSSGANGTWGTWGSGNGTWGTWGSGNGTIGTWGSGNGTWGSGSGTIGTWGSGTIEPPCEDNWKTEKCLKKLTKGKCHKRGPKKNCKKTCGFC